MCGPMRPFDMKILDNHKNEVIHIYRPLRCSGCCFPCCLQTIEISSPPGNVIGSVEEEWYLCYPSYRIKNASGEVVLRIEGPLCKLSMCGDVIFKVNQSLFWINFILIVYHFSMIWNCVGSHIGRRTDWKNFKTMDRFCPRNFYRCWFLWNNIPSRFRC